MVEDKHRYSFIKDDSPFSGDGTFTSATEPEIRHLLKLRGSSHSTDGLDTQQLVR
jgi:hypothetical protein